MDYISLTELLLSVSLILLFPFLIEKRKQPTDKPFLSILKEMFQLWPLGKCGQCGGSTYHPVEYFLIQRFAGLGSVGLLDAGTKISESVWYISRSISLIEYSSVAQTTDADVQKELR